MLAPEDYNLLGDVGKPLTQFAPLSFRPLSPTAPPISPPPEEPSDNNFLKPTILETNFNHPVIRLINKQKNTVDIIPKTKKDELIDQFNLSDQLSKLLPNIDGTVDEQNDKTNELPIDKMTDILSQIDNDKIPLELEFFGGGESQLFDNYVKVLRLSPNSLEFVNFFQSDECEEMLLANKLKIHVCK